MNSFVAPASPSLSLSPSQCASAAPSAADAHLNTRVFQRTPKGQAVAAAPFASQLGHMHQRVLLMVNGFTPLATLDELADLSGQAAQIAQELLARGLVVECKPENKPARASDSARHH